MKEIKVPASIDSLEDVLQELDAILESVECPPAVQIQLDVALEEMFVNIANYAYSGVESAEAEIVFDTFESGITVTLTDSGVAFDPLAKPDPDITLSAEERQIGGLGIYMVKKSMDEVSYNRLDDKNIFSMTKKW